MFKSVSFALNMDSGIKVIFLQNVQGIALLFSSTNFTKKKVSGNLIPTPL